MSLPFAGPSRMVYMLNRPALDTLNPAGAAPAAVVTLRCLGDDFNSASRIVYDGAVKPTTLISRTEVRAANLNVGAAGPHSVYVLDSDGGRKSQTRTLTVA